MARGFVFRIQESMGQRAALILRSCPGPALVLLFCPSSLFSTGLEYVLKTACLLNRHEHGSLPGQSPASAT
ncbi:hypothetical protein N7507_004267 [Penicillium longicatenatum]|nr:hypothetical protein N7507_004267 [Penicillium longicatenatum]